MYGVALADDLSKPVGEPVKLMEADQPWEKVRYAENRCNERAFVLKHGGRYYMTYSANHTRFRHYGIGYATADKPLGPWVKAEENPIAATNLDIGVSGPGHSCITSSPDGKEMFIVYHTHADADRFAERSERFRRNKTAELLKSASPVTYLSKDDPPVLILHGDKDPLVPLSQGEYLHKRYQEMGLESSLHVIEGAGHGGPQFSDPARYALVKEFFDRHVKEGDGGD